MGEPLAITYKEVRKHHEDAEAGELWQRIGEITGAGHVPPSDHAAIDLTDASDSVRARVAKLAAEEKDGEPEAAANETVAGGKVIKGGKK